MKASNNGLSPDRLSAQARLAALSDLLAAGIVRWQAKKTAKTGDAQWAGSKGKLQFHSTSVPNGASMRTAMEHHDAAQ